MMRIVPRWHRSYVRSHPQGVHVAAGVFASGIGLLVSPDAQSTSAIAMLLPSWALLVFNFTWIIGGGMSTLGLLRGWLRVEIAGLYLLAGGMAAYYLAVIQLRLWAAAAAVFIAFLASGSYTRARYLTRCGYEGDDGSR